jgi:S-disulfanyl-L-cysteine oxidoreductase SoxD
MSRSLSIKTILNIKTILASLVFGWLVFAGTAYAQDKAAVTAKTAAGTAHKTSKLALGRPALPAEVNAWNTDIRPDGKGLPAGKGSVKAGEKLFIEQCASCHGEFGEGKDRWPVLAGGFGSLKSAGPEKTVGSYWPYLSTVYDYIYRAMPFGNAQSLTPDQVYALTAYLLSMNDIVKDDFVLSNENFKTVKLPNSPNFYDDDREKTEKSFWKKSPCIKDCKTSVKVTGHARIIDVTPDSKSAPKVD